MRFCACKTILGAHPCLWEIMHIEQTNISNNHMIQQYKLYLTSIKTLDSQKWSLFQSCVLLLSCRLYFFILHGGCPPFLYTAQSAYIAASPFLIIEMRSSVVVLIYQPCNTSLLLKISVQLLFTHYWIPLSIWRP